jgi:hypothetical protein
VLGGAPLEKAHGWSLRGQVSVPSPLILLVSCASRPGSHRNRCVGQSPGHKEPKELVLDHSDFRGSASCPVHPEMGSARAGGGCSLHTGFASSRDAPCSCASPPTQRSSGPPNLPSRVASSWLKEKPERGRQTDLLINGLILAGISLRDLGC